MNADRTSSHVDKNLGHKKRVHSAQLALHVQAFVTNILLRLNIESLFSIAKCFHAQAVIMSMNKETRPPRSAADERNIVSPAVVHFGVPRQQILLQEMIIMLSVGCDMEGVAAQQLLGVHCMVLLQWGDHQSRLMVLLQLASLLQKHCRHVIT